MNLLYCTTSPCQWWHTFFLTTTVAITHYISSILHLPLLVMLGLHTTSPPPCVGPVLVCRRPKIAKLTEEIALVRNSSLFSSLALPPSNVNRHTPPSSAYTNVLAQCNTDYDLRPLLSNASSRASPSPCTDTVHLAWVMLHDVSWRMTRRGCLHNFQSSFHLR
jgi:hypothetical protein